MLFADLALSRRLERAEGHACAQFAGATRRLSPDSGAEWTECAGAYAVFDGIDSLVTQTFGLGIFEEMRGAALDLLCARQYRPIEVSNVMYRPVEKPATEERGNIRVRVIGPEEAQLWTNVSARGWTHEHPQFLEFLEKTGAIASAREQSPCFLAELDGQPGAAGALCRDDGVALFGGSRGGQQFSAQCRA